MLFSSKRSMCCCSFIIVMKNKWKKQQRKVAKEQAKIEGTNVFDAGEGVSSFQITLEGVDSPPSM